MGTENKDLDAQKLVAEAENNAEYTGLHDHLEEIKKRLKDSKNPSKELTESAIKFIEAIRLRKESLEKASNEVRQETELKLSNLKDEIYLCAEIQEKLSTLHINMIFESFLMLPKKEYEDINILSFLNTFQKVQGNEAEDWEKVGYKADGFFGGSELEELNNLKKKYDNDPIFKVKLDRLLAYSATNSGNYAEFIKIAKREGYKTKFTDSEYDVEKFDPNNKDYVVSFISDFNGDGKLETRNKDYGFFKKILHYATFTLVDFERLQGQNVSETSMQEAIGSRCKDMNSLNTILKRLGLGVVTPKTTKEELDTIKNTFWSKLIEKMTILGRNGKLEGLDQILDGTDKELMKNNLKDEEKIEKEIDALLDSKDTEIKSKLAELKEKYGLDGKIDSKDDLKRIKELIKGTIKNNPDIEWGIFGGVISSNKNPKGGDILGQLIKALDMGDYKGMLGFYVSKQIFESEDKKGSIRVGLANFIPYISANYAMTAYNCNKDKLGKAEKLEGNYTVVPFAAISPISISFGTELNFNDKNRAINEHVRQASEIFSTKESNKFMKINSKGELVIDRDSIIAKYEISNNEKAKVNLSSTLDKFEGYYNEYKTNDASLNSRLLDHLKISTVTFITNELYRTNNDWNFSGITLGGLFSLINPASLAGFVGFNIQYRNQDFTDATAKEAKSDKSNAVRIALDNAKEATPEALENLGIKLTKTKKDGKEISVYSYDPLKNEGVKNFYAGENIEIEETKEGLIYFSGKIMSIMPVKASENGASESFISFNGETEKQSYKRSISTGLELQTRKTETKTEVKGSKHEIPVDSHEKFENKDKVVSLINDLFRHNNELRYRQTFLSFQDSVADIYTKDGSINDAWDKLIIFADNLPKNERIKLSAFIKKIDNPSEKEKIMQAILGLTAGDWRIRLFNELHYDDIKKNKELTLWARKMRKKLGLRKDFKMSDIKDKNFEVINHPGIRKAEQSNMIRFFGISDKQKEIELRSAFETYARTYDQINNIGEQKEKKTKTEENAIVFVNFTQKNGAGKSTFHDIVPMYGNIDLHDGNPVGIENKEYKDSFVKKIPEKVLVSKFDQIVSKVKESPNPQNANYVKFLQSLESIKGNSEKASFIRDILEGKKNAQKITGSFDLSFVRWSTCQNAAYMIKNMKFAFEIPGDTTTKVEMETILPKVAEAKVSSLATTDNSAGQTNISVANIKSDQESKKGGVSSTPGEERGSTTGQTTTSTGTGGQTTTSTGTGGTFN